MNTPTTKSRVNECSSPRVEAAALGCRTAVNLAEPEPMARWRVNRVFWVKDALPHTMPPSADQWSAASGERENPGFRCWSGDVEVDVRSPLSEEAFRAMSLAEQVAILRTWKPETLNWDGPVREGFAAILQAEVKADPGSFFENASQFIGLDPLYATALTRGFSEGLAGGTVSNWTSFWLFANWVLAQPDPEIEIRDEFSGQTRAGRRWLSCRLEVARFLDAILNGDLVPLPRAERASVWRLIGVLTRDPSPAAADEAREDERIMDPFALSLNTVRGVAMHSVFSFVRWVRSHASGETRGGENLDDVPEAREVLEARLDPQIEPSLAIRSVYGANLTRLTFWADAWLRDHLEQIFQVQGRNERRGIAWETFIRLCRTDSKTLALLQQEYSAAVAAMSQEGFAGHRLDARVALGQHLVVNYSQGILDFGKPGDLLETFFTRAPESVRTEVMAFVGRSLAQSNGPIPPEILERLLTLWNWLVQHEDPSGGPGFQDRVA